MTPFYIDKMLAKACPETMTITLEEYRRRLVAAVPASGSRRAEERIPCKKCGRAFTPGKRSQRFCSRPCMRWWHYGPGARQRAGL